MKLKAPLRGVDDRLRGPIKAESLDDGTVSISPVPIQGSGRLSLRQALNPDNPKYREVEVPFSLRDSEGALHPVAILAFKAMAMTMDAAMAVKQKTAARKARKGGFTKPSGGGRGGSYGQPVNYSPFAVLPFKLRTRHFFTEYDELLTATTAAALDLKLNTIYDPDPHIGGGFVPGVSEFGAFYSNFRVDRVRVRLSLTNPSVGGTTDVVFLAAWPAKVIASGSESFLTAASQPGAVSGQCVGITTAVDTDSGWIDVARLAGRSPGEYRDDQTTWGTSGADPSTLLYYNALLFSPSNNTAFLMYSMEFEVEWMGRKELSS